MLVPTEPGSIRRHVASQHCDCMGGALARCGENVLFGRAGGVKDERYAITVEVKDPRGLVQTVARAHAHFAVDCYMELHDANRTPSLLCTSRCQMSEFDDVNFFTNRSIQDDPYA